MNSFLLPVSAFSLMVVVRSPNLYSPNFSFFIRFLVLIHHRRRAIAA